MRRRRHPEPGVLRTGRCQPARGTSPRALRVLQAVRGARRSRRTARDPARRKPPLMRIAAIQHDIRWCDREANFAHVAPMIAGAAASGARLVLLTETFSTGF